MSKDIIPFVEFSDLNYGTETLEVLRHEGEYYVAVPSMADRNLVPPNRSAKQLESTLGVSFPSHQFHKFRTSRNSKALNAIHLDDFENVLDVLIERGNKGAIALGKAFRKVGMQAAFSAAFGEPLSAERTMEILGWEYDAHLARCIESGDSVIQHLAQFKLANPDFVVEDYHA